MKKYVFCLTAAILAICGAASFTACAVDDNELMGTNDNTVKAPDTPEPTDDQMGVKVTADLRTYAHGTFDEGSTGAALVKRLPAVSGDLDPDTRLMLFRGSDFDSGSTLNPEDILDIARVYRLGGYIALERPTVKQLAQFMLALTTGVTTLTQNDLERTFGMSPAAAAAAARQSQAAERLNTRGENLDDDEKDPNEVMGEMVIFSPTGYFLQEPFETNPKVIAHSIDSRGKVSEAQTMTATVTRTPYISGKMADAVASWLNDMLKPKLNSPLTARRRANGNNAINDIMSASESFTYSSAINFRGCENTTVTKEDRMNMTVRSWGVHNMVDNTDYYYLQQDVKLKMQGFFFDFGGPYYWYEATNYEDYNRWYGAFLSQYKTSMDLYSPYPYSTIKLEGSSPKTSNDGVTTMISTGTTYGTNESIGFSFGFMISTNPGVNGGANFTWGTTETTSFSLGTNTSVYALETAANTEGTKVTWTYTGSLPNFYIDTTPEDSYYFCHEDPTVILVNDADVTDEICWSVANPKGQYSVLITSEPQTAALMYKYSGKGKTGKNPPHGYEYTTTPMSSYEHKLLEPNRYMQDWRMFITIDEWENEPVTGVMSRIEAALQEKFPGIYAPQLQVADKTSESTDMINYVLQYSKNEFDKGYDILQSIAQDYGVRKFSIYWRREDGALQTREPYVVEVSKKFKLGYTAQAVWCQGNATLYFVETRELHDGGTWDGQTITKVWKGSDVTSTGETTTPVWNTGIANASPTVHPRRVVFDESFADVHPKSCYSWFNKFTDVETIEGLEYLNTSEVTTMAWMFAYCRSLTTLDVDGFDMSKVTDTKMMFNSCGSLETIYCSQTWDIASSDEMFASCYQLKGATVFDNFHKGGTMANPETGYFTWSESANFVTLNENGSNSSVLKRYEGQTVRVKYSRTLTAKIGDDGNYMATPFTVCLPYDLDLTEAVGAGQVEVYTLAAVSANTGQLIFAKLDITTLEAGMPYLLRVMNGSIALSVDQATIKAAKPKSIKVYSSLSQWLREDGTEVGIWVGTFNNLTADDAADESAYSLQASDWNWNSHTYGGTTTIPGFRAYLSAPDIEQKVYTTRYSE